MSTKVCSVCKEVKEVSEYNKDIHRTDKLCNKCRHCCKVAHKKYRETNRSALQKSKADYYLDNKDKCLSKQRAYMRESVNKYKWKVANIKRLYGLSEDSYRDLIESQRNCCGICGKFFTMEGQKDSPNIDHNHSTGEVRGLLCSNCNVMLGYAQDSSEILMRGATYLMSKQNNKGEVQV